MIHSCRRLFPFALFSLGLLGSPLRSATLVWDPNAGAPGPQDGTGGWAVGAGNFFDETNLLENQAWADGAHAVFGAGTNTAGAVVSIGPITVQSLAFRPPGGGLYTLSGDTLTLAGNTITAQVAAVIQNGLAGSNGLDKAGAGNLTLSGSSPNALLGHTRVLAGSLTLAKTAGPAVGEGISLAPGTFLLFGANQQIPANATLAMEGPGAVINGNGVNVGQLNSIQQTLAGLVVNGGAFNAGNACLWSVDGVASFTGGAGNAIYVGNSGSLLSVSGLSLTAMPATAGANVGAANSFTVYGSSTLRKTELQVGAGGLQLNGSVLNLRRGNTGQLGSRLVLDGDLTTSGTAASGILEDTQGGVNGSLDLELSSAADPTNRVVRVAGGGANLNLGVVLANGASPSVSLTKAGAGTLTLSGGLANAFSGGITLAEGGLVLAKTAGQAAFGGHLVLQAGTLTWGASNQVPDTSDLVVQGGTVAAFTRDETLRNYTQTGGGFVTAGGNTGHMVVTNQLTLAGGATLTVNSNAGSNNPASWSARRVVMTGADLLVGGNNGAGKPRTVFTVGEGGLSMAGRTFTLNRGDAGCLLNLEGDFTGSGNNNLVVQLTGAVDPELVLGAGTRFFDVQDGTTTISLSITGPGAALGKLGPGLLVLSGSNTYSGVTFAEAGTLQFNRPASLHGGQIAEWNTTRFRVAGGATAVFRVGAAAEFTVPDIGLLAALGTSDGGFLSGSTLGLDTTGVTTTGTVTLSAPLANPNGGVNELGLLKSGVGTLLLSGPDGNTHSGPTRVTGGTLRLGKTTGLAVPGDLILSGPAFVTFAGNEQIADDATVTLAAAGSVLNGTAVNVNQLQSLRETIAGLFVVGGVFNSGNACDWNITGNVRFIGGAGNPQFLGNSGAILRFGGLFLENMNMVPGATLSTANSFALYGNSTVTRSSLTVGHLGLMLHSSVLSLRRGNLAGAQGSRLVLDGDVLASGNDPSAISEDPAGGILGPISVELSGQPGPLTRVFTTGADLLISVPLVNGAANPASLRKEGEGVLDLTAVNTYTGDTTVAAGRLRLAHPCLAAGGDVRVSAPGQLELAFTGTNTVDQLTLGGVGQPAGTHGSSASGAAHVNDARFAGPGVLLVTTGSSSSPYDAWASAAGLDGTPGHENGTTDDPDADGVNNLAEFALGGDPLVAGDHGTSEIRVADTPADGDADAELSLTLEVRAGASFVADGFDLTAALDGVRYRVSGSLALPGFTAAVQELAPALAGPAPSPGYERRTFRLVASNGLPGPGYLRIQVTQP